MIRSVRTIAVVITHHKVHMRNYDKLKTGSWMMGHSFFISDYGREEQQRNSFPAAGTVAAHDSVQDRF